jgi:hypothetical protein
LLVLVLLGGYGYRISGQGQGQRCYGWMLLLGAMGLIKLADEGVGMGKSGGGRKGYGWNGWGS